MLPDCVGELPGHVRKPTHSPSVFALVLAIALAVLQCPRYCFAVEPMYSHARDSARHCHYHADGFAADAQLDFGSASSRSPPNHPFPPAAPVAVA